jgi:hypothetical protein
VQVVAHALRVDAEVAAADAREGAHVDAAAGTLRGDADDDVVLEAEQQRRRGGLDAHLRRRDGDDVPAHRTRDALRALERLRRRHVEQQRCDVRIAFALPGRGAVLGRIRRPRAQRQHGDEARRVHGVGADVVDVRQPAHLPAEIERRAGDTESEHEPRHADECAATRAGACGPKRRGQRDAGGGQRQRRRPAHRLDARGERPPAEPVAGPGQQFERAADRGHDDGGPGERAAGAMQSVSVRRSDWVRVVRGAGAHAAQCPRAAPFPLPARACAR